MSRRPRVETADDGSATLRMRIPPAAWQLINRYAEHLELATEDAVRVLFQQIDALIKAGNVAWLSAEWQALARQPSMPQQHIVLERLHRTDKLKSGFYGVYAHAMGFRATVRSGHYLKSCRTAEEAAWLRYLHYKEQGWSYGEFELAVEAMRKAGERGTEAELRLLVLETAKLTNTLHLYADHMTPEERLIYAPTATQPSMLGFEGTSPDEVSAQLAADDQIAAGRDLPSNATHAGEPPLGARIGRRISQPKLETK